MDGYEVKMGPMREASIECRLKMILCENSGGITFNLHDDGSFTMRGEMSIEEYAKADRFDAVEAEYAKAKGEASKLRGRLDAVIALAEIEKDGMSEGANDGYWAGSAVGRYEIVKAILKTAKGEN